MSHPRMLRLAVAFLSLSPLCLDAGQGFTDQGADHLWTTPENWAQGVVPNDSVTHPRDVDPKWHTDAEMNRDGTTLRIDSTVDAHTFSLYVGAYGANNTFEMTGGSLTIGNWGLNVGRGGNQPGHEGGFGEMVMSGGAITTPYVVIPNQFNGDFIQQGEVRMSGGTIDAGWLRVGHNIGEGTVELSGTATINLKSHFEMNPQNEGFAKMDLSDDATINILGAVGAGNLVKYETYIEEGWLTANGGQDEPVMTETDDMFIISAGEPVAVLGDFNGDKLCDATDIDLLAAAIRDGDSSVQFDLNRDGQVNADDHSFMISDVKNTWYGDADLNQAVEFPDFLKLAAAFGEDKGWANGDFDGNGKVQFPDFLRLATNFGNKVEAAAAVPEPSSTALGLLLTLIGLVGRKRRP